MLSIDHGVSNLKNVMNCRILQILCNLLVESKPQSSDSADCCSGHEGQSRFSGLGGLGIFLLFLEFAATGRLKASVAGPGDVG